MDRIAIVSAVRDFAFYRKCVEENPMLDGCEKTVFDNRTENMPLPARYNGFLDSFDYSRPAWIVFCHEDWEAMREAIRTMRAKLDEMEEMIDRAASEADGYDEEAEEDRYETYWE